MLLSRRMNIVCSLKLFFFFLKGGGHLRTAEFEVTWATDRKTVAASSGVLPGRAARLFVTTKLANTVPQWEVDVEPSNWHLKAARVLGPCI